MSSLFPKKNERSRIPKRFANTSYNKILEKKYRDKRYIKNWRQISLLNADTKIIFKAFAEKLKETLPSIISQNQTAYVQNRFVSESGRF